MKNYAFYFEQDDRMRISEDSACRMRTLASCRGYPLAAEGNEVRNSRDKEYPVVSGKKE